MNTVVIVAGGTGKRMGLGYNKAFALLAGKPILHHTIQNFENCADISRIVITAGNHQDQTAEHDIIETEKIVQSGRFKKVAKIVAGGPTRMQSAGNGLAIADPAEEDIVLIQDGARPFTDPQLISQIIEAAEKYGAAICGTTPKDTIQKADQDGFTTDTYDRSSLAAVYTPVAAKWVLLKKAREKAVREKILDTPGFEDSAILQKNGVKVKIVPCGETNIKITTLHDLAVAEQILARGELAG